MMIMNIVQMDKIEILLFDLKLKCRFCKLHASDKNIFNQMIFFLNLAYLCKIR